MIDEGLINKVFGNDDMGHGVEQPDVGARVELQMFLGYGGHPNCTWISNDECGTFVDRTFHFHGNNWVGFAGIAANDKKEFGVADFADGVGHRSRTKSCDQTGHGGCVSH